VVKEPTPRVPLPSPVEYYVDEYPISMATVEIQSKLDTLGADGWQLLFIGPYGHIDNVRAYFTRPAVKIIEEGD
jgi:hypothetical protein